MLSISRIKKMTGAAVLSALVIIFQFIGNTISINGVSINLSLLPITIGALMYGPLVGAFLGFVTGMIILPGAGAFLAFNPFGTVVICLLKTTIAGLVAGLIFKLFKKKAPIVGVFVCSVIVPLVNTSLFILWCFTVFSGLMEQWAGSPDQVIGFVYVTLIGFNFIFELIVALVLTPSVIFIIKTITKRYDLNEEDKIDGIQ